MHALSYVTPAVAELSKTRFSTSGLKNADVSADVSNIGMIFLSSGRQSWRHRRECQRLKRDNSTLPNNGP